MKNKYLTEKERYQIEALRKSGHSVKEIASFIGKCERTIYYELKRGTVPLLDTEYFEKQVYCADVAQNKYEYNCTAKGRELKISNDVDFVKSVEHFIIDKKCSPYAALSFILKQEHKTEVCLKTLYNYIDMGIFMNITQSHLPYRKREKKNNSVKTKVCARNVMKPSIETRDKVINMRQTFGHWEMDTVYSGKNRSKTCLLVLTERMTRSEIIMKMKDRTALSTVKCINKLYRSYGAVQFRNTFKTITVDNGVEFSDYENIVKYNRTKLYYCHPYCSGERGSNENNNKLIRYWIQKGEDIGKYTDKEIEQIQDWLNSYPRKIFDGLSSSEMLQKIQS